MKKIFLILLILTSNLVSAQTYSYITVATPTNYYEAANKGYVDSVATGSSGGATDTWHLASGTFTDSWVDFGSGYAPVSYTKDTNNFVHLRGCMKSGVVGNSAFTLPAGYRPGYFVQAPCISNSSSNVAWITITTGGAVTPVNGSNVYFNIENVIFKAEN